MTSPYFFEKGKKKKKKKKKKKEKVDENCDDRKRNFLPKIYQRYLSGQSIGGYS